VLLRRSCCGERSTRERHGEFDSRLDDSSQGAEVKTTRTFGGALFLVLAGSALGQTPGQMQITGLPASDVLGSEDTWENPTFVGGVINGGPSASSEY
jgi:hypothetical protein